MIRVLYAKSHRRQPILWGSGPVLSDLQGTIPAGWCCRCRGEVYAHDRRLCDRCRKEKKHESKYRT